MAQRRDASTARKCRTRVCGASRRGRIKLKDSSGFHTDILAQSIARQVCAQFAVAWRGLCRRTSRRGSAADSHWLSSRRSARRIGSVGATSTALGLAQRGGREHRQAANAHLGRTSIFWSFSGICPGRFPQSLDHERKDVRRATCDGIDVRLEQQLHAWGSYGRVLGSSVCVCGVLSLHSVFSE